jgi:hypothetical protein
MSCIIHFNKSGKINTVLNTDGSESMLFKQISKLPHVSSLEEALEIHKNTYAEKSGIKEDSKLSFRSDTGENFDTYKEALQNSSGGDIQTGVFGEKGFIVLQTVSSNTNPSSYEGFINSHIKENILSDEKIIQDGEVFYKAAGNDQALQMANELVLKDGAIQNLNKRNIKIFRDGRIILKNEINSIKIEDKIVPLEEIRNATKKELQDRFGKDTGDNLNLENAIRQAAPSGLNEEITQIDESSLKLKLIDILNVMGVSITSITEYNKKYAGKNGADPSAEGLVDIAKQIVALKEGRIGVDVLAEETIHFIVEAWDEAEIENLLRNIRKMESYQEHAEYYREIYTRENPKMTAEQVENLVKREILGKELTKNIMNKFNMEGKTEIQRNIIQRIYDMLLKFLKNITVTSQLEKDIATLSLKVEDLLLSKDISKYLNIEQTRTKTFRMYQTQGSTGDIELDTKSTIANQLVRVLLEQERNLKRAGRGSATSDRILTQALDKQLTKSSALELIKLAKRQSDYIEVAIQNAEAKGETLTNEEDIVLHSLKENIKPLLDRLMALSKTDEDLKDILPDIERVVINISRVQGKIDNIENKILNRIVDRLVVRWNLDEKDRAKLIEGINSAKKDTSSLYSWFGQITHADDPLLRMLGVVISDMTMKATQKYQDRAKDFQAMLYKNGFTEKDLPKFMDKDGYILSIYDWSKFNNDLDSIKAQAYITATGSANSEEEIIKMIKEGKLPKITDIKQKEEYSRITNESITSKIEKTFTEDYYKERDQKYKDLGISNITKTWLKTISTDLGKIISRTKTEKGLPRYTAEEKHNLNALNLQRRGLKSLTDNRGNLKIGLIEVDTFTPGVTLDIGGKLVELNTSIPEEAREEGTIAFEINKLDQRFMEDKKQEAAESGKKIDVERLAPKFLEELQAIEEDKEEGGRDMALEFFLLNSSIGFSNDFWANYDNSESFNKKLDDYLENPEAETGWVNQIKDYRKLLEKRKSIIKQYQDSRNFTNTLAEEMPDKIKELIIEMSSSIDDGYSRLTSLFKTEEYQEPGEKPFEVTPNQAYYEALQDQGIEKNNNKRFDFAIKHMTPDNAKRVRAFSDTLENFLAKKYTTDNQRLLIQKISGITDLDSLVKEDLDSLKIQYAEGKLAPYYRAFSPVGLDAFYKELRESNKSVHSIVSNLNSTRSDIKMSNNFSYYEAADLKQRNGNYKENFEGGRQQPKLSQYLNPRFVEMFNPVLDANNNPVLDVNGKMTVRSNQKLYNLYEDYLNFQKDTLRSYGELGEHNLYSAPQLSKTQMERITTSIQGKKGSLKDWWSDITRYRIDEQAFGEELDGESLVKKSGLRLIPKYFLKRFPDQTFISNDLFYSSMAMAQQAELYKAKKESFSEFAALHDMALSTRYPQGKEAQATNTYKMFKSYFDYNMFGVKEIKQWRVTLPFLGQVDLSKLVNWLHNWLKNNSLALNVVVPFTSWITAEAGLFTERLIGQYVDKDSYAMGFNEFRKLATPAMKEGLAVYSKSKLSIIGESFRAFDVNKRFEDSQYGNTKRGLGKSFYALHTVANFSPISNGMLSQLFGHRIYNGKLVDFRTFSRIIKAENPKSTEKTIRESWRSIEDKNLYRYIITEDSKGNPLSRVTYDYENLSKDMGRANDEKFKKDFSNIELGVISRIGKVIERIDGQIKDEERTMLQRDVVGKFTMTHKGWLSIAYSNRFKGAQLNLQNGMYEEGSYISLLKFLTKSINMGFNKNGLKGSFSEIKSQYLNEESEVVRENMKRVLLEMGVLSGIFLVSLGLGGWADDDEDNMLAQTSAYLFERMANETSSSQFGVIGEFYSSAKEPLVGLQKIENLVSIGDLFNTDIVKQGRYKGTTYQEAYAIKNIVGASSFFDFWSAKNLKSKRDTYDFFNKEEAFTPIAWFIDEKTKEEIKAAQLEEQANLQLY